MSLRWSEATVEWRLRDHEMWHGVDTSGRCVALVSAQWRDGGWTWAAYYWGDRPPALPVTVIGRDPDLVGSGWATAEEAMGAVDGRHERSEATDPG